MPKCRSHRTLAQTTPCGSTSKSSRRIGAPGYEFIAWWVHPWTHPIIVQTDTEEGESTHAWAVKAYVKHAAAGINRTKRVVERQLLQKAAVDPKAAAAQQGDLRACPKCRRTDLSYGVHIHMVGDTGDKRWGGGGGVVLSFYPATSNNTSTTPTTSLNPATCNNIQIL